MADFSGSGARRRRARAAVVLAVALAAAGVVGAPSPVSACSFSGPSPTPEEYLARANLVFDGLAVASRDPKAGASIVSSADPIVWTFVVDRAIKGSPSLEQEVATARSGGSCGFTFQVGVSYRVYASAGGDGYTTNLGSGTTRLTDTAPATTTPPVTTTLPPADVARIPTGVLDRTG